jgi:uncharacterized protein YjbJ (UPF0337 family)
MRSTRKNRRAGKADGPIGRALEAVGRLTGNRKTSAKGKAARTRGRGRNAKARVGRRGR